MICPLCTDVMVQGIMILVAQMLQCRIIIGLFSVLKNNIGTYKSKCIIHNTERKLLNERIRNINNTIENLEHVKYMYENELKDTVSKEIYQECEVYIENAKETRHNKVLQRQVSKFERLIQKNSAEKSGHSKQCHSGMYMYMHSGNSGRYMYQQDTDTN